MGTAVLGQRSRGGAGDAVMCAVWDASPVLGHAKMGPTREDVAGFQPEELRERCCGAGSPQSTSRSLFVEKLN